MRPNVVLGLVVAVVAALAVAAVVISAARPAAESEPGSPEAVVLDYLDAVARADSNRAVALLDPELHCTPAHFEDYRMTQRFRATVVDSEVNQSDASVRVNIEEGSGLLDSWQHTERFELTPAGDAWLVTGQPWPVGECWQRDQP